MIRQVIFDLDGTLLNTIDDLGNSMNYILRKHGYPEHSIECYKQYVGNGIPKLVERSLPEMHNGKEEQARILSEFLDYYDLHKSELTAPYAGICELLIELQSRGICLSVASNKVHEMIPSLMKKYFPKIHFSCIFGTRAGIPSKPNPQIIFDILQVSGIMAEESLYIGDTATDIETAKNGHITSIGALWGFRDRAELETAGASYIISTPLEILSINIWK